MGLRIQYWLSTALAVILLVLVIINIGFYQGNVSRRQEVNSRQNEIQQALQLEGLYREILQALANTTIGKGDNPGDKQIEQMLASQGIKVNAAPANSVQQAPSAAKQK